MSVKPEEAQRPLEDTAVQGHPISPHGTTSAPSPRHPDTPLSRRSASQGGDPTPAYPHASYQARFGETTSLEFHKGIPPGMCGGGIPAWCGDIPQGGHPPRKYGRLNVSRMREEGLPAWCGGL